MSFSLSLPLSLLSVNTCVDVHEYTCIYIYMYAHLRIHIYVHKHQTNAHVFVHMLLYLYICTHAFIYACACACESTSKTLLKPPTLFKRPTGAPGDCWTPKPLCCEQQDLNPTRGLGIEPWEDQNGDIPSTSDPNKSSFQRALNRSVYSFSRGLKNDSPV